MNVCGNPLLRYAFDLFQIEKPDPDKLRHGYDDSILYSFGVWPTDDDALQYGIKRRSGRYPYGSGENPYQHESRFLNRVNTYKAQGLTEKQIADEMDMSTTQLRTQKTLESYYLHEAKVETAKTLVYDKGLTPTEAAKLMGFNSESSVRALLKEDTENKRNAVMNSANFLKERVDEVGMIDVGLGVAKQLGISENRMQVALEILKQQGYEVYTGGVKQQTNTSNQTRVTVLCPPGTQHKDIYEAFKTNGVNAAMDISKTYYSDDGGDTFSTYQYPSSMSSSRLAIRYAEDGGADKDGVVEIRPGCKDLNLGGSNYAQVRILVDGTHYIKGMAMYSNNLPDGVDVMFNTNKSSSTAKMDVLKKIKETDPSNPFGAIIKANGQSYYTDENGNKQLSLINKTREEGDWNDWNDKTISSQFLSKQNVNLAQKQLTLAVKEKQEEYETICSLENDTVKKKLLLTFADDCDSAAVHLTAAALPRQKFQVILPLTTIKDTEVYAPQYNDGETVALVRYPHGGTFEIPILKVNNKNKEAKTTIGNALDAVGISSAVAAQLSGADFDGDTVLVIPCNSSTSNIKITTRSALEGLKDFDPKVAYPGTETSAKMTKTQTEMGKISNLITDMTIKGANDDELARAVKHSMVVIDAEKKGLDYKRSYIENGILALKKRYQTTIDPTTGETKVGKPSTLISRAKNETHVPKRRGSAIINEDGTLSYKTAYNLTYVDKNGKVKQNYSKSTQMADTDDAMTLSSGTEMEAVYGAYANTMKQMAKDARVLYLNTSDIKYNPTAKVTYASEVASLKAQLDAIELNKPAERQAQIIANSKVEAILKGSDDTLSKKEIKKIRSLAISEARASLGVKHLTVVPTDKEWEAIQSGAVSANTLKKILDNTDIDKIRQLATPKSSTSLSQAKINKIRNMFRSGYSISQIANAIGCSTSTVQSYVKGDVA